MLIKSILVTAVAPFDDHAANRGEKLLGNASSIKRRPDGRVYVSGQMQRHALFSALDRINRSDDTAGETYVANGDGLTTDIEKDLRSDLGGYLDTNKGDYSGRRTAPVSATPAVALKESSVGRDLLVRLKMDSGNADDGSKKQALATNEFSQHDEMVMNFSLDVGAIGTTREYTYADMAHVATAYKHQIDDAEHGRRVRLFLEATGSITDYANQARNAVSGEPNRVLIVLDSKHSRKASRYWKDSTSDGERANILAELRDRGAQVFLGDDRSGDTPVYKAYKDAYAALEANQLYRPK